MISGLENQRVDRGTRSRGGHPGDEGRVRCTFSKLSSNAKQTLNLNTNYL